MDSLATVAALGTWLNEILDDNDPRAIAVLDHASNLVRIAAGTTWLSPSPIPDGIPQLTVRVAARLWQNPTGLASTTTGPFSATFAGEELTQAERNEVRRILNPTGIRGLGTISTTRGEFPDVASIYVNVAGSDKPIQVTREPL